ncbi:MAG: addiction module protein [Saprospiraceae bacterium]|nr:addiction module protein [Saprospiraceae bacterium]
MTASTIKEEVKKLPRSEQLSLIQFIVNLLQEDNEFILSDAWKAELDKRDEDYQNGTEKLHTGEEAKQLILNTR